MRPASDTKIRDFAQYSCCPGLDGLEVMTPGGWSIRSPRICMISMRSASTIEGVAHSIVPLVRRRNTPNTCRASRQAFS
jgi:hypothetical protein